MIMVISYCARVYWPDDRGNWPPSQILAKVPSKEIKYKSAHCYATQYSRLPGVSVYLRRDIH